MTSIRKFAYAVLLAVTTLNLAPSLASAQEPARGKFTLTHEVHFGNAKLPAGDYQFSYDTEGVSPVMFLSKISGTPAGYMVLVHMTEEIKSSTAGHIVLETSSDGSYVSSMQLPEFGMTLYFTAAAHGPVKRVAKAGLIASASK
jgi:hypothetical protein